MTEIFTLSSLCCVSVQNKQLSDTITWSYDDGWMLKCYCDSMTQETSVYTAELSKGSFHFFMMQLRYDKFNGYTLLKKNCVHKISDVVF